MINGLYSSSKSYFSGKRFSGLPCLYEGYLTWKPGLKFQPRAEFSILWYIHLMNTLTAPNSQSVFWVLQTSMCQQSDKSSVPITLSGPVGFYHPSTLSLAFQKQNSRFSAPGSIQNQVPASPYDQAPAIILCVTEVPETSCHSLNHNGPQLLSQLVPGAHKDH